MPVRIIVRQSIKDWEQHGFREHNLGRAVWRPLCECPVIDHQLREPTPDTVIPTCLPCLMAWGRAEADLLDAQFDAAVLRIKAARHAG